MIPRFKPNIGFLEFLKIFKISKCNQVEKFEAEYANLTSKKYGLSFAYGRMALFSFLKAENIFDREIICPAYTCIVVAHAIEKSGNRCVFVDVNYDDFLMNSNIFREAINEKTAAIVFTSLFGNPVNIEDVNYVREIRPDIKIIQDCTHSIDGIQGEEKLVGMGDVAIYGLGLSKPITSVFGGILTTNNRDIFERVKSYQRQCFVKNKRRDFFMRIYLFLVFIAFNKYFYTVTNFLERNNLIDYFTKLFDKEKVELPSDSFEYLSPFEAGIGSLQVLKFKKYKEQNRQIYEVYQHELKQEKNKVFLHPRAVVSHCNILIENRDLLTKELLKHGVQLGNMYEYSLPELKPYANNKFFHYNNTAKEIAKRIVNLPLCVSKEEAAKISRLINSYSG